MREESLHWELDVEFSEETSLLEPIGVFIHTMGSLVPLRLKALLNKASET